MDTAYPLYFSHRKEETHTAETTAAGWATDNVVEIVGIWDIVDFETMAGKKNKIDIRTWWVEDTANDGQDSQEFSIIWCKQAKQKPFPKPWKRGSPRRAPASTTRCTFTDPKLWSMIANPNMHEPVCQRRALWTSTPLSSTPWRRNRPWNWSKTATLWSSLLTSSPTRDKSRPLLRNCTTLNAKRSIHSSLRGDWKRAMCDWARTTTPSMWPTELVSSKLTETTACWHSFVGFLFWLDCYVFFLFDVARWIPACSIRWASVVDVDKAPQTNCAPSASPFLAMRPQPTEYER